MKEVKEKETFLKEQLQHKAIKAICSAGLWIAIDFDSFETNQKVIHHCIQQGLITDWFLFRPQAMRIAPPLCIEKKELKKMANIILQSIADAGIHA
jgi:4-aminobutyrate aminotransferase-like enzyme